MPLVELYPFLLRMAISIKTAHIYVNALSRALSISTIMALIQKILSRKCVNALSRALSISTNELFNRMLGRYYVSMPLVELYPFLQCYAETIIDYLYCVNALSRALSISTDYGRFLQDSQYVSMPLVELYPFLRYPFKNPVKSRVSSPVFAGN